MAALPYDGTTDNGMFNSRSVVVLEPILHRSVRTSDGTQYWLGAGIVADEGNPAPSYKFPRYGILNIRLAVAAGSRVVSAQVKQPNVSATRPFLRVLANPGIGLNTNLISTAGASTGWQSLALGFTATQNGGVMAQLCNADLALPCWFDNVQVI